MITFGEYVAYEKLQSKEEVKEWLHDENVYSNLENYESLAEELCNFKDTIKRDYNKNLNTQVYKNIYAHELTIMLPLDIDLDNKNSPQNLLSHLQHIFPCSLHPLILFVRNHH